MRLRFLNLLRAALVSEEKTKADHLMGHAIGRPLASRFDLLLRRGCAALCRSPASRRPWIVGSLAST
jgi:hypothetical protein